MKYFISTFDMENAPIPPHRITYLLDDDVAKEYYEKYLFGDDCVVLYTEAGTDRAFKDGKKFIRESGAITVWGEDVTRKEIFQRRLNGTLEKVGQGKVTWTA